AYIETGWIGARRLRLHRDWMRWGETPAATSIFRMIIAFPSFILKEPVTVLEGTSETLAPTCEIGWVGARRSRLHRDWTGLGELLAATSRLGIGRLAAISPHHCLRESHFETISYDVGAGVLARATPLCYSCPTSRESTNT